VIGVRFVFATLGLKFTGDSVEKKSLGGSESALVYLARSLAKRGHDVTVYCNCDEVGEYHGVDYKSIGDWNITWQFIDCDVFIVSRFFELGRAKVNSKVNILWNHDINSVPSQFMSTVWAYDFQYCLTE
jgi:hypothetical protein